MKARFPNLATIPSLSFGEHLMNSYCCQVLGSTLEVPGRSSHKACLHSVEQKETGV